MSKKGKKTLSSRQLKAIKILCSPEGLQVSQKELAKRVGVAESTMSRWHGDPVFQKALDERVNKQYLRMQPFARTCLEERMKKDTQAIKLYYSIIGKYKEQLEVSGKDGGPIRLAWLSKLSESELEELKQKL